MLASFPLEYSILRCGLPFVDSLGMNAVCVMTMCKFISILDSLVIYYLERETGLAVLSYSRM